MHGIACTLCLKLQLCITTGKFDTAEAIPELLNAFMTSDGESNVDFWGTLGDNW